MTTRDILSAASGVASNVEWIANLRQSTANVAVYVRPSVKVDSAGNVYFCGRYAESGYDRAFIAKYNKDGVLQWQKRIYKSLSDSSTSYGLAISPDSSRIAISFLDAVTNSMYGFNVIQLDSSGNIAWQRRLETNYSDGYIFNCKLAFDSSNNLYTALRNARSGYYSRCHIIKLDTGGSTVWGKYLVGDNNTEPFDMFIDSSDKIYVCGEAQNTFYAVLNSSGDFLLNGKVSQKYSTGICADASGNFYVTSGSDYGEPVQIHKIDSSGSIVWRRQISPAGANQIRPALIAVDANNDVYVSIQSYPSQAYSYYVKYDSSGTLQWRRKIAMTGGQTNFTSGLVAQNLDLSYYIGMITQSPNYMSATLMKVPKLGTKTGTYTIGDVSFYYESTTEITDGSSTVGLLGYNSTGDLAISNLSVSVSVNGSSLTSAKSVI